MLNSGSSSEKSCLYDIGDTLPEYAPVPKWEGRIEWDGDGAEIRIRNSQGATRADRMKAGSRDHAIKQLLETLWSGSDRVLGSASEIEVVGHRIVHGGRKFRQAVAVTEEVKTAIAGMAAFAPLHNRAELEGIEIVEKQIGQVLQVAVFDTAFHSELPEAAAVYPGPYEWLERGIRRYGFHGINHGYCAERSAQLLGRDPASLKLVSCHLGNGCSLAAIRNGRSIDTTMGFTPLEGLMMGTRSGSIDPGILTYLMRQERTSGEKLDDLLNTKSGLLGISGISPDMRQIVAAMKTGHARAKLAFEIFVHRLQAGIGAMAAALSGIDALVFTAGIGENSPEVRAATCATLGFLGVMLNAEKNAQSSRDEDISEAGSAVRVLRVSAQEDWAIARECRRVASERAKSDGAPSKATLSY